ncbi:casein kinase II subunit beta-like [Acyrthosiphon pisum]|uniref:Casein kinase II subunit beta n=1 Tax=Acyrthosiphon pisum TaxID=7029 RepID=A0A8R2NKY1_ACYPI|nr:casein kinase II subunit beta-like [Acyrthosiphon pisum]XP_029342417.1 casein kinase II subunit beta-like [Acyrthosiphon pisum]|eukprot:XP_003246765.1 PREDICTED: casein kinase II subunit beta-like [Acyrthosiphon pisum]
MHKSSTWIKRLLNKPENAFMCMVDMSYIQDKFNLVGLENTLPDYESALRVVLDDAPLSCAATNTASRSAAELVYGLVHARYVMTPRGVAKILEKYMAGCFGHCPRENCKRSAVLPIGLCDIVGENTVRIFCPRCMDVYIPPSGVKGAAVDGAYFGTGLPHMVLMTRPEYIPSRPRGRHVAKLYGFRIHDSAYDLQRNSFTEFRRSMQQPPSFTSTATAGITSTNTSTTAASSVVSTTDAASTTTTTVSSNASNQTSRLVHMINAYRRAPLLKR